MMRLLKKFFRLSREDRSRFIAASCRLITARILTRFLSYQRWNGLLASRLRRMKSSEEVPDVDHLAWMVSVAARHIPGKYECLPQAVATCWTLRNAGQDAEIRVGVRRSEEGEFEAHAWVVLEDRVVIGGLESDGGVESFEQLFELNPASMRERSN